MNERKALLILHGKQALNEEVRAAVDVKRQQGWELAVRLTWEAGDAQRLVGACLLVHLDLLVRQHLAAQFRDDLAVHPHPAASDVALGVAARAGQLGGQAFGQALRFGPAGVGHVGAQDENRKFITSPSLTTYSLPSARILPASLAPCSPLNWMKSSKAMVWARM